MSDKLEHSRRGYAAPKSQSPASSPTKTKSKKASNPPSPNTSGFQTVNLSNSQLKSLECFEGCNRIRLEFLYVRNNLLQSLYGIGGGYLPNLKVLDVSNNKLKSLQHLIQLPSLKELYLNGNDLSSLSDLPTMPKLEILSASQNSIKSFCDMNEQPELKVLFVCGNKIENLEGVPMLPHLESLRVNENPFCDLLLDGGTNAAYKITSLVAFPKLTKLDGADVDYNEVVGGKLPIALKYSIRDGFTLKQEHLHMDTETLITTMQSFILEKQKKQSASSACPLKNIQISGEFIELGTLVANFEFTCDHQHNEMAVPTIALRPSTPSKHPFSAILTQNSLNERSRKHSIFSHVSDSSGLSNLSSTSIDSTAFGSTSHASYQWYKAERGTDFKPIPNATSKVYRLKTTDIFSCLKVECTTMLPDGSKGAVYHQFTADIVPLPPTGLDIALSGTAKEGEVLTVKVQYVGGIQGNSIFEWYRCPPYEGTPLKTERHSHSASSYDVSWDDVGSVIQCKFIPVRIDGTHGPSVTTTSAIILAVPPEVAEIGVHGTCCEGETLEGRFKYKGGPEATHEYRWYRSINPVGGAGSMTNSTQNLIEFKLIKEGTKLYCPLIDDVGCIIKFEVVPKDQRGVTGQPKQFITSVIRPALPKLTRIVFEGPLEEGKTLTAKPTYYGGREGNSVLQWYRTESDASLVSSSSSSVDLEEIPGEHSLSYTPTADDVGCLLYFSYTPYRLDGMAGKKETIVTSHPIKAAFPSVDGVVIVGEHREGCELIAKYKYVGGEEGKSQYGWYRSRNGTDFTPIPSAQFKRVYFPKKEDIGHVLKFEYLPIRDDGVRGEPKSAVTTTIIAGVPTVTNVQIVVLNSDSRFPTFQAQGTYHGGIEGRSAIVWERITDQGEIIKSTYQGRFYPTSEIDRNCSIRFGYQPVRADGVTGEFVYSEAVPFSSFAIPAIENYSLEGNLVEGDNLTFYANYRNCDSSDCIFKWFRKQPSSTHWKLVVESIGVPHRTLTMDDIDSEVRCETIPRDRNSGKLGKAVVTESYSCVKAAMPRLLSLSIGGQLNHQGVLTVHTKYFGGIQGALIYEWSRTQPRTGRLDKEVFEPLAGPYQANLPLCLDDIGCKFRVVVTPIRKDGTKGQPQQAESGFITLEPSIENEMDVIMKERRASFEIHVAKKDKLHDVVMLLDSTGVQIISSKGNKTRYSIQFKQDPVFQVTINRQDATSLWMDLQGSKPKLSHVKIHTKNREQRDLIVLCSRRLYQDFVDSVW